MFQGLGGIPCDECSRREAGFAVGVADHRLVCEPCLDWGDARRVWNLMPRQPILPAAGSVL